MRVPICSLAHVCCGRGCGRIDFAQTHLAVQGSTELCGCFLVNWLKGFAVCAPWCIEHDEPCGVGGYLAGCGRQARASVAQGIGEMHACV